MKKNKKMITIIVCFIVFNCTSISFANNLNNAKIVDFDVFLNGVKVNNVNNDYPLIIYNDITYFPLTWNYVKWMGLDINWSEYEGLIINRSLSNQSYATYETVINDLSQDFNVRIPNYKITVSGEEIDNCNEAFPFINFRNITYFPLTWENAVERFGWNYSWSPSDGLKINSRNEELDSTSMQNEVISLINKLVYNDAFDYQVDIINKKISEEPISFSGHKTSSFTSSELHSSMYFENLKIPSGGEIITIESIDLTYNLPGLNPSEREIKMSGIQNPNVGKQLATSFLEHDAYVFTWLFFDMSFVNDKDSIQNMYFDRQENDLSIWRIEYLANTVITNIEKTAIAEIAVTDNWDIKHIKLSVNNYEFNMHVSE